MSTRKLWVVEINGVVVFWGTRSNVNRWAKGERAAWCKKTIRLATPGECSLSIDHR